MSKLWEDTNGCAKQYRCVFVIYLVTVLSSQYCIIMDRAINAHGYVQIVLDGLTSTKKCYLKETM